MKKPSEIFEGEDSSLRKTFDTVATKDAKKTPASMTLTLEEKLTIIQRFQHYDGIPSHALIQEIESALARQREQFTKVVIDCGKQYTHNNVQKKEIFQNLLEGFRSLEVTDVPVDIPGEPLETNP